MHCGIVVPWYFTVSLGRLGNTTNGCPVLIDELRAIVVRLGPKYTVVVVSWDGIALLFVCVLLLCDVVLYVPRVVRLDDTLLSK